MHQSSFRCTICRSSFTRKEHLQRHERSHNRERPFACSMCGKQFGRKDLLTRHVKSDSCGRGDWGVALGKNKRPPRCRVACQACIASKCRCVKSLESDLCVRCLKRKVECVVRATSSGPDEVGKPELLAGPPSPPPPPPPQNVAAQVGADSRLQPSEEPSGRRLSLPDLASVHNAAHQLLDLDSHFHNLLGPSLPAPPLLAGSPHGADRISPHSISALVTPNGHCLLNEMPTPDNFAAKESPADLHADHRRDLRMEPSTIAETPAGLRIDPEPTPDALGLTQETPAELRLRHDSQPQLHISNPESPSQLHMTHPPPQNLSLDLRLQQDHQEHQDRTSVHASQLSMPAPASAPATASRPVASTPAITATTATPTDTITDPIEYNLRKAFAYNAAHPPPDDEINWVSKFDLSGVQNSIRTAMDVANTASDPSADVLESYISKKSDFFSEATIETYFDQLLDFGAANATTSPMSDNAASHQRELPMSHTSRDLRSEAFAGSSLLWKRPAANAPEAELQLGADAEASCFATLAAGVDRNSTKFKRFQVVPATRDLVLFAISDAHHGDFWRDLDLAHGYLPLADELTLLVIEFFERFHTRYHIIHLPTFNPNKVPVLLLMAIVGAAASFADSSDERLYLVGRYFFEVGRRKIIMEFESNNSNIRDIQLQQANLIHFITASWSGIDRNVELSQSFTFTLSTMTRRGDLFKQISYPTLLDIMEDPELATTEEKWCYWVVSESKKLLVYVLFYWCSQFSVVMNFPSFVNYGELELPLPHLEPLWRAANAADWFKLVELIRVQSPRQYLHHILLQLLIGPLLSSRDYSGPSLSPKFFTDVLIGTLNAAVRQFVIEHNDRVAFTNSIPNISGVRRKKRKLLSLDATFHMTYLVNRQAEIENMLELLESYVGKQSPKRQAVYKLEIEYSFVCLYASIKDCLKLAGIDGESESRQAIPRLLEWYKKDDARFAVWHCAQILKLAQQAIANNACTYSRSQFRDPFTLLTLQSCHSCHI